MRAGCFSKSIPLGIRAVGWDSLEVERWIAERRAERDLEKLVSRTSIPGLDLIVSNDELGQLGTLLLHAPDGRLRMRNLLPIFQAHYDLLLIDTQGARSVLLEMAQHVDIRFSYLDSETLMSHPSFSTRRMPG